MKSKYKINQCTLRGHHILRHSNEIRAINPTLVIHAIGYVGLRTQEEQKVSSLLKWPPYWISSIFNTLLDFTSTDSIKSGRPALIQNTVMTIDKENVFGVCGKQLVDST